MIANAAKLAALERLPPLFDVQIVDEAFQLPDYRFLQIAMLAERIVLVGNPGQIAPIVRSATERWQGDPAGPQVACSHALMAR